MENLFTLRAAQESDRAYIDSYTYSEGMDNLPDLENVTVAVNASDEPVGFIRIFMDKNNMAYVNPVIVHSSWRGYGVGRALMEDAQKKHGELRLVSRGYAVPFYDKLGFTPCDWSLIAKGASEDCDNCSMREECSPLPMRKTQ